MSALRSATKLTKWLITTFSTRITSFTPCVPSSLGASGRQISTGRGSICLYKVISRGKEDVDLSVLTPFLGNWMEDVNRREGLEEFLEAKEVRRSLRPLFHNTTSEILIQRGASDFMITYEGPGPHKGIHKFKLNRYFIYKFMVTTYKTRYFLIRPDQLGLTMQDVNDHSHLFETTGYVDQDTLFWNTRHKYAVLKMVFDRVPEMRAETSRRRG